MSIRDVYIRRSWTKIMAITPSDHLFFFVQIFILGTVIQTFFYPVTESQGYAGSRQLRKNLAVSKHKNNPYWLRNYKWKTPEKNYGPRQKPFWERTEEGRKRNRKPDPAAASHQDWLKKMQEISRQERAKWNRNDTDVKLNVFSTTAGPKTSKPTNELEKDESKKTEDDPMEIIKPEAESSINPDEETLCIKIISRDGQKILTPNSVMILRRNLYPEHTRPVERIFIDSQPSVKTNSHLYPDGEDEFYRKLLDDGIEPDETSYKKHRVALKTRNKDSKARRYQVKTSKSTSKTAVSNCGRRKNMKYMKKRTRKIFKIINGTHTDEKSIQRANTTNPDTALDGNYPKNRWGMSVKTPPKEFIVESNKSIGKASMKKHADDRGESGDDKMEIQNRILEVENEDFGGLYRNGRWGMKASSAAKDLKKTISSSRQRYQEEAGNSSEGEVDGDVRWNPNTTLKFSKKQIPRDALNSQRSSGISNIPDTTGSKNIKESDRGIPAIPSIQQLRYDPPRGDREKFFPTDETAENLVKKNLFLLSENLRAKALNNRLAHPPQPPQPPQPRMFQANCKNRKSKSQD